MKSKVPIRTCMCCKTEFESQKRFSRRDKKYRNYCPNCRKICYLCLCRHGSQGDTCSQYCSNRYRSIKFKWKKLNPKRDIQYLENALKGFHLNRIEDEILEYLFTVGFYESIKNHSYVIRDKMIALQDSIRVENIGDSLCFNNYKIEKNIFFVNSKSGVSIPIYDLKSWKGYL